MDMLLSATPKVNPENNIMGVVGGGQAITDLKKSQVESKARAKELTALVKNANAPIIEIDRELNITN